MTKLINGKNANLYLIFYRHFFRAMILYEKKKIRKEDKNENISIDQLDLSEKTLKALKVQRINTVAELTELMNDRSTAENILGIKAVEEMLEKIDLED